MAKGTAAVVGRALLWGVVVLTLSATALLTVPRLIDPDTRRGIELVSLTPFGLAPAVVLAVSAIVLAVLHHGALRFTASVVILIGVVSTALHVEWLAPLYVGDQPAGRGEGLVVMTQSFEYGDGAALAEQVRARRVDVLVFSDLSDGQRESVAASTIPRELPHATDNGGGLVVLSRYPLSNGHPLQLHGNGRSVRIESSPLGPLTLFALHAVQPRRPAEWQQDAAKIDEALSATVSAGAGPTIVAGDLNATPDHLPFRQLEALGLRDAVDAVNGGFQPTYPAPGSDRRFGITVPPLLQIDHVLVSAGLVVTSVDTVQITGADHLGVVATIRRAAG